MSIAPRADAVVVLDGEGRRLVAKYSSGFLLKDRAAQKTFEDKLFSKTKNAKLGSDSDVVMLDRKIIVFKARADVLMYVVGSEDENELILDTVLDGVTGALSILLGGDVSANNILEHLDVVMLSVDETVDDGIILEIDPKTIVNRVLMQGADGSAKDITDMTISQAMEVAREQLLKNVV